MPFSFIILTYNSAPHIKELLDSLISVCSREEGREYEIIVFDNNSTDNTTAIIEKYTSTIKLHKSKENLGYAKGINEASKYSTGKYLVVINPDAKMLDFDFEKIKNEFENEKNLAIAGLRIEDYRGVLEKSAGNFYNRITFLLYTLGLESIAGLRFASKKVKYVDFVSGGFVVFRKSLFEKLNGYDTDYFMYVEDMDICMRAKKEGLLVKLLPYAKIKHKGQGSSNRAFAIANIYKGLILFYTKNKTGISLSYVRRLLRIKATLIIFVSLILGRKESVIEYRSALKLIS